jgi:hypothetical protein
MRLINMMGQWGNILFPKWGNLADNGEFEQRQNPAAMRLDRFSVCSCWVKGVGL